MHAISDVTNLQASLDGKTDESTLPLNVKDYGAFGNARQVSDAVLNGTTTVTSATAAFTQADVGKKVWGIEGATGLARLTIRTVATVLNSTTITVSGSEVGIGNYTGIILVLGTDDSDAIRAAFAAALASTPTRSLRMPAGGYVVSKLLFDQVGGSDLKGLVVEGEGSESTKIFPSPEYSLATTTTNTGMISRADGNSRHAGLKGMTIDGSQFNFSASGYHVVSDYGAGNTYEDLKIQKVKGTTAGLALAGVFTRATAVRVEALGYIGIACNSGHHKFTDCYSGNHGYLSVSITDIAGTSNLGAMVEWEGGVIDESTGGSLEVTSSTDVVFVGARLFGAQSYYGAKLNSGANVRFIGCQLIPFGTGNRGGLRVMSGATAILIGCRLAGSGSLFSLDNAGTVIDGGGNTLGTTTGSGSLAAVSLGRFSAPATAGYPQFCAAGTSTGWRAYDDGSSARCVDAWINGGVVAKLASTGLQLNNVPIFGVGVTNTPAGTTGARTINAMAGSVNFAAATTSLVVTNSLVTANSCIVAVIATNDATAANVRAVAASGSFTLHLGAAPTSETRVNFIVLN